MIPRNQAVLHPSLTQVYSGNDLNIILEMFAAFEEYWLSGYMYELCTRQISQNPYPIRHLPS